MNVDICRNKDISLITITRYKTQLCEMTSQNPEVLEAKGDPPGGLLTTTGSKILKKPTARLAPPSLQALLCLPIARGMTRFPGLQFQAHAFLNLPGLQLITAPGPLHMI